MDPYFELITLIYDDTSIEEITDLIRDNLISAENFDTFYQGVSTYVETPWLYLPCPLSQAAWYGRWDVMKALFHVGFDPQASYWCFEPYGTRWIQCSAIYSATLGGRLSVIRSQVEEYNVDVNAEHPVLVSTLHCALRRRNSIPVDSLQIVKCLVKVGANIEKEVSGYYSDFIKPIHIAAANCLLDICEYLLFKGAKVIDETGLDPTAAPLRYVAYEGNDLCTHLLLQNAKGLNPHEELDTEQTLLHVCAEVGRIESVKFLCSLGWNPDAQDMNGQTPLHCIAKDTVCLQMMYNIVYFLIIEQNASMYLKHEEDETPFDQVVSNEYVPLVELFLSAGYQTSSVVNLREQQCSLDALASKNKSIHKILTNPRTLQDLCCFRVRGILGLRLPSAVDSLQLPNVLTDFLRLKHVVKLM